MKKALLVTTVSGFVPQFEMNNVRILQEMGYEVHYASNYHTPSYGNDNVRLDGTGIIRHQIDFARSPFAVANNSSAYKQLKILMTEYRFDLVHCHTPMGAALARLTAKSTDTSPVIYTVHGLHFYRGAPWINWLVYYPVEKYLSKYTDILITINHEDYSRARKFSARKIIYLPGVGIDTSVIAQRELCKADKRRELGIGDHTLVAVTVGELIKRKNFSTAIAAFSKANLKEALLLICGHGILREHLQQEAIKFGVADRVRFLGYRKDILDIMKASDLFLFPSFQEGLSVALMEAMAVGLPVICSGIRGNIDLIEEGKGGYLLEPKNTEGFSKALRVLGEDEELRKQFGQYNSIKVQQYDIRKVSEIMYEVYSNID